MLTIAIPAADFNVLAFALNVTPRIEETTGRAYLSSPNAAVEYVTTLEVRR